MRDYGFGGLRWMLRSVVWAGRPAAALVLGALLLAPDCAPRAAPLLPTEAGAPAGRLLLVQAQPGAPPNVETSIAQLRQRLQITPAQQPQFEALAAVMRENAQAPAGAAPASNASAVDALRFAIRSEQQDLAGMRRLLPALQALYATLSPAQRQAADIAFRQGPGG